MIQSPLLPESTSLDKLFQSLELQKIISGALLDPLSEFLSRPGKNIRSELVELGIRLSGTEENELTKETKEKLEAASTIVELIHNGSLIVDDIQDSSLFRRNKPALHIEHGVPLALNAGNWLYFWALSRLKDLDLAPEIHRELTDDIFTMLMKAHAGQAVDLGTQIDKIEKKHIRDTCLASMELKSGTLMSLALRLGAGIRGKKNSPELYHLGSTLGMLLQIYDDIGNFLTESSKRFEDLHLKRPTWIWAVASHYEETDFHKFASSVNCLPDESPLMDWMEKNKFRERLFSEASTFKMICESSWSDDWLKTHPHSLTKITSIIQKLEKAYVQE